MTPVDVLKAARAKISDPERWTQGALARTSTGERSYLDGAEQWCAVGAMQDAAFKREQYMAYAQAFDALDEEVTRRAGEIGPASYNDAPERTHGEILGLFDAAIARLEAKRKAKR